MNKDAAMTYWCQGCDSWGPAEHQHNDDTYQCTDCGNDILCDECGAQWTDDHHDYEPGDVTDPMHTDPLCHICGGAKH